MKFTFKERQHLMWYIQNYQDNATGSYNTESSRAITKILESLKNHSQEIIFENLRN